MVEKPTIKWRAIAILNAYPIVILLISVALNLFVFGVKPPVIALPTPDYIQFLIAAIVLLVINHSWIMTSTELTRSRYKMHATPEEWKASGTSPSDISEEGLRELERRHNTHRNTTENVIYFVLLGLVFVLVSPPTLAVQAWIVGFAIARLGYTYSYLAGNDNIRGLFMSLGLLALYGMTSYLLLSLFV